MGLSGPICQINSQNRISAVMNLGPQPTVDPSSPSAVEVHLLDQKIELQNSELTIEPVKRLRGQQRFSSLESLSAQISLDATEARETLQKKSKPF